MYCKFSIVEFSSTSAMKKGSNVDEMPKKRGRPLKHAPKSNICMLITSTESFVSSESDDEHPYVLERKRKNEQPSNQEGKKQATNNYYLTHASPSDTCKLSNTSSAATSQPILVNTCISNNTPNIRIFSANNEDTILPKRKIIRSSILSIRELLN